MLSDVAEAVSRGPSVTDVLASAVAVVFFGVQGALYRQTQTLQRAVGRVQQECATLRQLLIGINGDNGLYGDVRKLRDEIDAETSLRATERQAHAVWQRGVDDCLREYAERLSALERHRSPDCHSADHRRFQRRRVP